MSGSLKDQLLKAGLVSEKQVKKAKKDKYQKGKEARNGGEALVDHAKIAAEKARLAKLEKDKALNQELTEKAKKKAISAQIKQLIETNRLPKDPEGPAYNFSDGKRVKKINISEEFINQLSKGRLCIVKLGDQYEVIPVPVADKIAQRDESRIIVRNEKIEVSDEQEEDWYADYEIPDDLMW
ncbi:DUF2058 domain-containing protein [Litoribacillus peritrichatus]|uniref:DUF2058 family protein n=1 Tax=Litoribacillus peritrichatus TaxID=718191 RepID=A0ABP7MFP2_9GAMM